MTLATKHMLTWIDILERLAPEKIFYMCIAESLYQWSNFNLQLGTERPMIGGGGRADLPQWTHVSWLSEGKRKCYRPCYNVTMALSLTFFLCQCQIARTTDGRGFLSCLWRSHRRLPARSIRRVDSLHNPAPKVQSVVS